MSHPKIKKGILKVLRKLIVKEMKQVCQKKTSSMLRKTSAEALKSFSWDDLLAELEKTAPVFCQILKECVNVKRRNGSAKRRFYSTDSATIIGVVAAILLRHHNEHLNLVQRIISILLYSGHAPKQVLFNYCFFYITIIITVHLDRFQAFTKTKNMPFS